jgi:hypothetical protein
MPTTGTSKPFGPSVRRSIYRLAALPVPKPEAYRARPARPPALVQSRVGRTEDQPMRTRRRKARAVRAKVRALNSAAARNPLKTTAASKSNRKLRAASTT